MTAQEKIAALEAQLKEALERLEAREGAIAGSPKSYRGVGEAENAPTSLRQSEGEKAEG